MKNSSVRAIIKTYTASMSCSSDYCILNLRISIIANKNPSASFSRIGIYRAVGNDRITARDIDTASIIAGIIIADIAVSYDRTGSESTSDSAAVITCIIIDDFTIADNSVGIV